MSLHPGILAFLDNNLAHARRFTSRFDAVQTDQCPDAITVCCADSRVLQDHMWDNDQPGRLFTCSNIGNRVIQKSNGNEFVAGDVLYPLVHTGTDPVVIVGHTGCGAITVAYDELTGSGVPEIPGITYCIELLTPHLAPGIDLLDEDTPREQAINRLVEYNVDRQIELLQTSDDVPESVSVLGVVYDFQDVYSDCRGKVSVININGNKSVDELRQQHPKLSSRINRLWEY